MQRRAARSVAILREWRVCRCTRADAFIRPVATVLTSDDGEKLGTLAQMEAELWEGTRRGKNISRVKCVAAGFYINEYQSSL